jgi:hypothetical protein
MIYAIVFIAPFLGPFIRNQPFLGVRHLLIPFIIVLLAFGQTDGSSNLPTAILFYGIYVILCGFWQMHCTWNYRKHGVCVHDHIDGR